VAILLALFVAAMVVLIRTAEPEPGAVAEKRGRTRIEEEELVKRFILNNAKDEKAVKFTRWGPHMLRKDYDKLMEEAGPLAQGVIPMAGVLQQRDGKLIPGPLVPGGALPSGLIRVCYHDPNDKGGLVITGIRIEGLVPNRGADGERDYIFTVSNKMVIWAAPNHDGDGWKVKLRKNLAKMFPGINP
jgi:hypothetical protein